MKRILTMLALLVATVAAAQEVEIRQPIDPQGKKLKNLVIQSGWDVRLVQHADSTTYVSIVTTLENAEALQESAAVTVKQQTLTVNPCPARFKGTRLEIHSNFDFVNITLNNAEVSADSLRLYKHTDNVRLRAIYSDLHVGTLNPSWLTFVTLQQSVLRVDTLGGGWTSVTIKDNSLLEIGNYRQEKLHINLYDAASDNSYAFPDSTLVCRQSARKCCDSTRHIFWEDSRGQKWTAVTLTISMQPYIKTYTTGCLWDAKTGWLWNHSSAPFDSPYYTPFTFELKIPMLLSWKLNDKLSFQTGLQFQLELSPLGHQCRTDENGHLVFDNGNMTCLATTGYMGLPLRLTTKTCGRLGHRFSADLFFGWGTKRWLFSGNHGNYGNTVSWHSNATDYYNHWKIEMGLGWDVTKLVIIKGLRFYANLLPEYGRSSDLPDVRTMGLEIKF